MDASSKSQWRDESRVLRRTNIAVRRYTAWHAHTSEYTMRLAYDAHVIFPPAFAGDPSLDIISSMFRSESLSASTSEQARVCSFRADNQTSRDDVSGDACACGSIQTNRVLVLILFVALVHLHAHHLLRSSSV